MIPLQASELQKSIKTIKLNSIDENEIVWTVFDMGTKITLTKEPLVLKFRINSENEQNVKKLIRSHFDEMKGTRINPDACNMLRTAFYEAHEVDGSNKVTYNYMSLLHFFGTWLGPTSIFFKKGHAIMNNLHYEFFGFHQYHGKQYDQTGMNRWKPTLNDCGNSCKHEMCLKHAKSGSRSGGGIAFYKDNESVFSAYYNYFKYFLDRGLLCQDS